MPTVYEAVLPLAFGYLVGAVPTPYLLVRALAGADLRASGTGNVGVMNASRALGRYGLAVVFAVELVKGLCAALAGGWLSGTPGAWLAVVGCVAGENWSLRLRGAGGRGNTVFGGGLATMAPMRLATLFTVWIASRRVPGSSFRATTVTIVTMPAQIALWRWLTQPRPLFAFTVPRRALCYPGKTVSASASPDLTWPRDESSA